MQRTIAAALALCLAAGLLTLLAGRDTSSPVISQKITSPPQTNTIANPRPTEPIPADDESSLSPQQQQARTLIELRELAETDPHTALALALTWPDSERDAALAEVCFGTATKDPLQAIEFCRKHHLEKIPGAIEERLVQQWASSELHTTLAWLEKEPASESRDHLTLRVAYILSQSDPIAAANLTLAQMSPGEVQDEALITVIHQWARKDPSAVSAWIKDFPAGPLQARAMKELAGILPMP